MLQHASDVTRAVVQPTVGKYEPLRELGRGATSILYLARQVDLDRQVSVKGPVAFQAGPPSWHPVGK